MGTPTKWSDNSARSLFDAMIAIAQANLKRDGHLTPVLFKIGPGGKIDILAFCYTSREEKLATRDAMGSLLRAEYQAGRLLATIDIGEAWYKAAEPEELDRAMEHGLEDNHTGECLTATLEQPGILLGVMIPFCREDNAIVFGERQEHDDFISGRGSWSEIPEAGPVC